MTRERKKLNFRQREIREKGKVTKQISIVNKDAEHKNFGAKRMIVGIFFLFFKKICLGVLRNKRFQRVKYIHTAYDVNFERF